MKLFKVGYRKTQQYFGCQESIRHGLVDGLWLKQWEIGVKGRMWWVIKAMYEASRSVFRRGKSDIFCLEQGVVVAPSPILFSFLLVEVQEAGVGVQLNCGKCIGGLLFADDFVGISDSNEKLTEAYYCGKHCNRWRLKANVGKCAVMVF